MMNLDRELLFRFFNKETTLEEEKKIRLWIDECDEHRREFFRERQLFDAILLHGDPSYEKSRPRFYIPWHKVVATLSGIAAIVILTIITTTYFLQQSFRDEVMNTVTVPQGQRVHLTLSDGTKVWLNAKTKMEYPQSFKVSDQRIVKVDGEAYFEVSKNKEKPFIVKTTKGDVEVLGTKFYISAYATTDVFETSLIEGKVKVHTAYEDMHSIPKIRLYWKMVFSLVSRLMIWILTVGVTGFIVLRTYLLMMFLNNLRSIMISVL